MIKVKANAAKKCAETEMQGRTDALLIEFAMTVKSISNGLINGQPDEQKQDAMRHILSELANDAISGEDMGEITEVIFHASDD